jgi:hypothetical protein
MIEHQKRNKTLTFWFCRIEMLFARDRPQRVGIVGHDPVNDRRRRDAGQCNPRPGDHCIDFPATGRENHQPLGQLFGINAVQRVTRSPDRLIQPGSHTAHCRIMRSHRLSFLLSALANFANLAGAHESAEWRID